MTGMRRIIHATDFSPSSRKALATALMLAKTNRAALTLIHVIAPIQSAVPEPYVSTVTWEDIQRQTRVWVEGRLKALAAKAKKTGVRATARVLEGDPSEQIVRAAHAQRADAVVIGTHGRTGLQKFFIGSVAEHVIRKAACPVVVVRGGE